MNEIFAGVWLGSVEVLKSIVWFVLVLFAVCGHICAICFAMASFPFEVQERAKDEAVFIKIASCSALLLVLSLLVVYLAKYLGSGSMYPIIVRSAYHLLEGAFWVYLGAFLLSFVFGGLWVLQDRRKRKRHLCAVR